MARRIVAIEGCPMADSRVIDHKALSSQYDRVPILVSDRYRDTVVGFASDFQRDEDGNISYEIMLNSRGFAMGVEKQFLHISVGQCLWDQVDDTEILVSGVIYSLFYADRPTPWDVINHEVVR